MQHALFSVCLGFFHSTQCLWHSSALSHATAILIAVWYSPICCLTSSCYRHLVSFQFRVIIKSIVTDIPDIILMHIFSYAYVSVLRSRQELPRGLIIIKRSREKCSRTMLYIIDSIGSYSFLCVCEFEILSWVHFAYSFLIFPATNGM